MESILRERLGGLLPINKIICTRRLQFLRRVAQMEHSRLTFQVLSSQAKRTAATKFGGEQKTNTRTAWKNALVKAELADSGSLAE